MPECNFSIQQGDWTSTNDVLSGQEALAVCPGLPTLTPSLGSTLSTLGTERWFLGSVVNTLLTPWDQANWTMQMQIDNNM